MIGGECGFRKKDANLAGRPDVVRLVVQQGGKLMVSGLVIGLALALALGRLLSSQLFQVSANDPVTFLAVTLILSGVAAASCYLQARQAPRVDPLAALRPE